MTILSIDSLGVSLGGRVLVHDISFHVDAGETLAVVGESGSGKTLTALSILNLLPPDAIRTGTVTVDGTEIDPGATTETSPALRRLRGGVAGMVFQEPMTSLNPLHRVGRQVAEAAALHGRAPTRPEVEAMPKRPQNTRVKPVGNAFLKVLLEIKCLKILIINLSTRRQTPPRPRQTLNPPPLPMTTPRNS